MQERVRGRGPLSARQFGWDIFGLVSWPYYLKYRRTGWANDALDGNVRSRNNTKIKFLPNLYQISEYKLPISVPR